MKKRIKVAYIHTPVDFDGAEKVGLNLLANIDRNKFDIHPILLVRPWEETPYFVKKIDEYGYKYDLLPVALKDSRDPFRVIRVFNKIYSILKKTSFDLVHTNGYFVDICGLPAARMLKIPSISTCHGFINNNTRLRFYNRLDIFILKLAQRILCVSSEIQKLLINAGLSPEKLEVLPNAVYVQKDLGNYLDLKDKCRQGYKIARNEFLIGYCGRLSEEKGLQFLLEAHKDMATLGIRTKVILIGEGPLRKELERKAQELGTDDMVIFAGFMENTDELMQSLDAFVLPSLTEGTPMALLEAMAVGVPVIASAVGEIPSVINNLENGILINPGRSHEIAEALNKIIFNESLRSQFSQNARDTINKRYNMESWMISVERNYFELIYKEISNIS